jgi:predicted RNA-binding protein with PIN domain
MPYLIDGNNLMGHIFPHSFREKQSKYNLIYDLLIFQRRKRTRVSVVFDGAAEPGLEKFQKKEFSIIYPPLDQKADEIIKEIISRETDLRRFFVVSSDREIKSFAKSKGAKALSSKEFNRELKTALKQNRKFQEFQKEVSELSPLEIDHWLMIFKGRK